MPHTYATVAELNDYIVTGGGVTFAAQLAPAVSLNLAILESVSRRIDNVCHRSAFGSGFGPRIGTNYYDGDGDNQLFLRDDLQALTAFTIAATTGGSAVSPVVTTDYFLANADAYSGPPYRKVILHGMGSPAVFGTGYHTITATGTWGHSNVTVPTGATVASGLSVGTTATTFTTSASSALSPGMTLLIETEQVYLSALAATTATIVRGVNGTTAATHADTTAIARYVYDSRVHDVAIRLAFRRKKASEAGADGTSGGLDVPAQQTLEGEDTIIRRGLADLLLLGQY